MQYYQFILGYYLKQHQKAQIESKTVAKILNLIFYLQLLSLILITKSDSLDLLTQSISFNFLLTFQYVGYIGRPYKIFIENKLFKLYSFIVPTIFFYIISFGLIKKTIQKYFLRKKISNKKKKHISNFDKLISIIYQVYFYVFALYSFDLQITAITEIVTSQPFQNVDIFAINIVQCVILLIFIQFNILSSESIHFLNTPLQVIQLNKYQFFIPLLIIVNLYLKNLQYSWIYIPVQLINMIILIYYIYEEVRKKNCFLNLISIILLSLGLFYNFTTLIFVGDSNKYQIGVIFVLCPFFINLLVYKQKCFNKIIINKTRSIQQIYQNLTIIAELKEWKKQRHQFEYFILAQKQDFSSKDLFLAELSLFNYRIMKISNNSKAYWYQKYILIKYYLESYTETISLIFHFNQKQIYSEVNNQYFRVNIQLSFLQQIQLNMIKQDVLKLLYFNITRNSDSYQSNLMKQYIEYKIMAENSQETLKNLLIQKCQLYESILSSKMQKENELFNKAIKLTKKALHLEKLLRAEVSIHKTFKILQLLTMLLVEFFNNILQAELIRYSYLNNEDIKENALEEMTYVGIQIQDDMLQMKIQHFSSDFFTNIGYNKSQKELRNIEFNSLLADDFVQIHQSLVATFLKTGVCKKVGRDYEIRIRGYQNNYYYTTLQLQIQPLLSHNIQVFAFCKMMENQPRAIFVKNDKIFGQSYSFIKYINQHQIFLDEKQLYLMDINKLFFNYKKISFQKITKVKFINYEEEFIINQIQYVGFTEIQILDQLETQNISFEQDEQILNSQSFEPNQESIVIVPNSQIYDELQQLPLSEERRDKTDQVLLKEDVKLEFKSILKSIHEYQSQSMVGNFQNNSKNSFKLDKLDVFQADDQASSKFSKGFLDTSIYYAKYNKLQQLLSKQRLQIIYTCIFLFLILIIINTTYYIISIARLVPDLQQSKKNQDLLIIKSNFLTPVHDCIVSQQAYVSYYLLYYYKQISLETAIAKSEFSGDAIKKSYQLLKDSYITQLNNQNLQEFFQDETIEMNQQNSDLLDQAQLPLNTALFNYLKSQFFVIFDNQNFDISTIASSIASNDYIYFMANILTVDNHFDKLSDFVLNLIVTTTIQNDSDGTKIFLKLTFLQSLFILLAFSFVFRIYSINNKYFTLFTDINQFALQVEVQKLNQLIIQLQKDNYYKNYNYDIAIQERKIQSNLPNYFSKANQIRLQAQKYKPPRALLIILLLILFVFFMIPQVFIQQIDTIFYDKYQKTCEWIEIISQTSAALSAIYSYREINYQISSNSSYYNFFTDEARLAQNEKVQQELDKIDQFITEFPVLHYSLLITDDSTLELIQNIQKENICNFVNQFNSSLAQDHCVDAYNGVAKLGIYNTISTIHRQISLEYENTQGFQIQLRPTLFPYEELEISLISSNAILSISDYLMAAVVNETDNILILHNTLTGIYISFNFILLIILFFIVKPYLIKQQQLIKSMIYLIPQYQFYLDLKFDTDFRLLLIQMK